MCQWTVIALTALSLTTLGCDPDTWGTDIPTDAPAIDPANPPSAGTSTLSIEHGGMTRIVTLHVPSTYDGTRAMPLLLNFHGNGGSGGDFLSETGMTSLADTEGVILVYPQGSMIDGTSHWNPLALGGDNKSSTDDVGFIDALLDTLIETLNVDANRVYAAGYSNGAFMAYGLACMLSDRITAIGAVSGTMINGAEGCTPTHPTPVISLHGTNDVVVPYAGGGGYPSSDEIVAYWVEVNGLTGEATTTPLGAGVERTAHEGGQKGSAVVRYKIEGGDHVWFDRRFEGASTGQLIWDFVSQHDLSVLMQP